MEQYVYQIIEALCAILGIVLIRLLHNFAIKAKQEVKNAKASFYIDLLEKAIQDAVSATNQTYVDALKEQGKFDESAQKFAFNKTKKAVMDVLGENGQKILEAAIKDLDAYIDAKIEAAVKEEKIFTK